MNSFPGVVLTSSFVIDRCRRRCSCRCDVKRSRCDAAAVFTSGLTTTAAGCHSCEPETCKLVAGAAAAAVPAAGEGRGFCREEVRLEADGETVDWTMNWKTVWQHITTLFVIVVVSPIEMESEATEASTGCPVAYWDEPSKRCSRPLITTLDTIRPADAPATWSLTDLNDINRTCTAWQTAKMCYQQLLTTCRTSSSAVAELQMQLQRYFIYSYTCSFPMSPLQQTPTLQRQLVECFLPHVLSTSTCTEAFDKYFRGYVADKQYRNACRVVSSAMRCFHEIQSELQQNCAVSTQARQQYEKDFIQPLVQLTRDVVVAQCAMSPLYEQYVTSTATVAPSSECVRLAIAAVVAFLIARWRISLFTISDGINNSNWPVVR